MADGTLEAVDPYQKANKEKSGKIWEDMVNTWIKGKHGFIFAQRETSKVPMRPMTHVKPYPHRHIIRMNPVYPFAIVYHRTYGLAHSGSLGKSLCRSL
jgi:hypothetical protein